MGPGPRKVRRPGWKSTQSFAGSKPTEYAPARVEAAEYWRVWREQTLMRSFLSRVFLNALMFERISHFLFVVLKAHWRFLVIRHCRVRIPHFGQVGQPRLGQQKLE